MVMVVGSDGGADLVAAAAPAAAEVCLEEWLYDLGQM
jgi:hypothetical protein